MEAEIDEAEYHQERSDQLNLIEEGRLEALCHGQCYQKRVARAYDKVKPRKCKESNLVLMKILPFKKDLRSTFKPNFEGPYLVNKVLSGGTLILLEMEGDVFPESFNSDSIKKKICRCLFSFF